MHISLDAALQRQPLLSTVGDKLLPTFPGAAAAYSLRALNGDANDVVNVRRSGDDEERDFTAEGVSFELADWVNGKQETVLPADDIPDPSLVTGFTISGSGDSSANGVYAQIENQNGKVQFEQGDYQIGWTGTVWRLRNADNSDTLVQSSSDTTYPWDATGWTTVDGPAGTPIFTTFRTSEGVVSFGEAAAAYSLRKVRNAYTGDAVHIRRASDDVEVNVAFDSNGEVSTSSAITNVVESPDAGDTTATTLGEFLTEDVSAYYDAEDGTTTGWISSNFGGSSTTISNVTSGAISGSRSIQVDITSASTSGSYPRVRRSTDGDLNLTSGLQYNIKCKLKLTAGAAKVFARLGSASGNTAFGGQILVVGEVLEIDNTFTASSIGGVPNNIEFIFDSTIGIGTILIDDLELTQIGNQDATVVTWYDQAGSNDATQDTAASQPKIAEGGSLLTDGIDFDGVDDYLRYTGVISSNGQADTTVFVAKLKDNLNTYGFCDNGSTADPHFIRGTSTNFGAYFDGTADIEYATVDTNENLHFVQKSTVSSQSFGSLNGTTDALNAGTDGYTGGVTIGATRTLANYLKGSMKELIIYASDQSDNRFKIESNINNHYGIYTAAYNGFVETWYDQSGNGNNAVQTATGFQPKIVSAGSLLDELDFDGGDDKLSLGTRLLDSSPIAMFAVVKNQKTTDYSSSGAIASQYQIGADGRFWLNVSSSDQRFSFFGQGTDSVLMDGDIKDTDQHLLSVTMDGSTARFHQDGVEKQTDTYSGFTPANVDFVIGNAVTSNPFDGTISELIIYQSDQTANRPGIESNIADEYGITLP